MGMVYHYLYKIKCDLNDMVYWGVHSTADLQDGYMGSGVALQEAKNQYGEEHFYKVIMAHCDSREKVLELERLVVAGERGNCLNKISGGGGVKRIPTDCLEDDPLPEVDVEDPILAVLMRERGIYDLDGVSRLLAMDIGIKKPPMKKELKKILESWVKDGRLAKVGKNYQFPVKELP